MIAQPRLLLKAGLWAPADRWANALRMQPASVRHRPRPVRPLSIDSRSVGLPAGSVASTIQSDGRPTPASATNHFVACPQPLAEPRNAPRPAWYATHAGRNPFPPGSVACVPAATRTDSRAARWSRPWSAAIAGDPAP